MIKAGRVSLAVEMMDDFFFHYFSLFSKFFSMPVYYFSQNHIIKIYFKHTHVKNWMETHQKYTPWCWERLKVGGQGDNRGWDGWMASPTQWTWVWVISGSWWWTGRPGVLQSLGVAKSHTQLSNWTELTESVFISDSGLKVSTKCSNIFGSFA